MSESKPAPKAAQTPVARSHDHRQSVLEKIEAALRAEKISIVESGGSPGSDPYNTARANGSPWSQRRR